MRMEDFIAEEDIVVTITRGGYAKRTRLDNYRAQRRGGKGVRGAQLKQDDIVQHFFVTTTHHWILFFTNKGRVYRTKAYELPELARDSRGHHVANLVPFLPDEEIAQVLALRDYNAAPYLVLATRSGLVKKTKLSEFDSARSSGIIAINLREDDELIAARLVFPTDDLLLISSNAQAIRFPASDESLRPMGRATSGVIGMRFAEGDYLLSMDVIREGEGATDVLVATEGGYAKRTPGRPIPGAEARRQGCTHSQDCGVPWQACRRADGRPRGRDPCDHLQRRRDPHQVRGDQAVAAGHHGRSPHAPLHGQPRGRYRPQHGGNGRRLGERWERHRGH